MWLRKVIRPLRLSRGLFPRHYQCVKVVGVPPDRVHDSVEDRPEVIESGMAVKELITGAVTVGVAAVTVTVTD